MGVVQYNVYGMVIHDSAKVNNLNVSIPRKIQYFLNQAQAYYRVDSFSILANILWE